MSMTDPTPEQVEGQTQSILADPELVTLGVYGNCMQAAIATVLRKPLDAVPHFGAFSWWTGALRLWLRGEGLDYTRVEAPPIPNERAMLVGKSPRGHSHAVASEGGRIIWDPHPSRAGLVDVTGAFVIHEWDTEASAPDPIDSLAPLGYLSPDQVVAKQREAAYRAMWQFFLSLPHSPFSDMVQREALRLRAVATYPTEEES